VRHLAGSDSVTCMVKCSSPPDSAFPWVNPETKGSLFVVVLSKNPGLHIFPPKQNRIEKEICILADPDFPNGDFRGGRPADPLPCHCLAAG